MLYKFLLIFAKFLVRINLKIKVVGKENLPRNGGVLILPNHVTYLDSSIVWTSLTRPVRFLIFESYYKKPILGIYPRAFNTIPITKTKAKEALVKSISAIKSGDWVCIFSEGLLTYTGTLNPLQNGMLLIQKKTNCPIVPMYFSGTWSTMTSEKLKKRWKYLPLLRRTKVFVTIGKCLSGAEISSEMIESEIRHAGVISLTSEADLIRRNFFRHFFQPIYFKAFKKFFTESNGEIFTGADLYKIFVTSQKNARICNQKSLLEIWRKKLHISKQKKLLNSCINFLRIYQTNLVGEEGKMQIYLDSRCDFEKLYFSEILFMLAIREKMTLKIVEKKHLNFSSLAKQGIQTAELAIGTHNFCIAFVDKNAEIPSAQSQFFTKPTGIISEEFGAISLPLPEPKLPPERSPEPFYEKNTFGKLLNGVSLTALQKLGLAKNSNNMVVNHYRS